MDHRQLYVAWVRSKFPDLYVSALRKVTGKSRSLGGLGDDLLGAAFSPDVGSALGDTTVPQDVLDYFVPTAQKIADPSMSQFLVDTSTFANPTSYLDTPIFSNPTIFAPPDTPAPAQVAATSSGGWWAPFTNAVAQIGTTLLKSQAQNQLLNVNTQRAKAGLAPVDANGRPITAASLGPASAQVLAMERALAGTGNMSTVLIMGGVAILALLLFSGSGKRR